MYIVKNNSSFSFVFARVEAQYDGNIVKKSIVKFIDIVFK